MSRTEVLSPTCVIMDAGGLGDNLSASDPRFRTDRVYRCLVVDYWDRLTEEAFFHDEEWGEGEADE